MGRGRAGWHMSPGEMGLWCDPGPGSSAAKCIQPSLAFVQGAALRALRTPLNTEGMGQGKRKTPGYLPSPALPLLPLPPLRSKHHCCLALLQSGTHPWLAQALAPDKISLLSWKDLMTSQLCCLLLRAVPPHLQNGGQKGKGATARIANRPHP